MGDIQVDPVLTDSQTDAPTPFIVKDISVIIPPTEMAVEAPDVIVVENLSEQGRANLANNPKLVAQLTNASSAGEVHKDGKVWTKNPGGEWPIEKLETGTYKVTHNWGYFNTSLSVQIGLSRGTAKVVENSPTYFVVETYVDGFLTDAPFAFTLTKVISQPR